MKVFCIADTHFGHDALSTTIGTRPDNFEERIIKACQRMVSDDDLLIFLGDVVVGKADNWLTKFSQIPGHKILVMGNHDKNTFSWYMNNGFDFVCSQFRWKMFGIEMVFSHKPLENHGDFNLNIHGHLHLPGRHNECELENHHFLLSMDKNGYQPHTLESIVKIWQRNTNQL